jgi:hypothetical protein
VRTAYCCWRPVASKKGPGCVPVNFAAGLGRWSSSSNALPREFTLLEKMATGDHLRIWMGAMPRFTPTLGLAGIRLLTIPSGLVTA